MSFMLKTIDQVWAEELDKLSNTVDLELSERVTGMPVREAFQERFHIQGKMPKKNGRDVYFGWYIRHSGKAKFWTAFGQDKLSDVFNKSRWVV